MTLLGRPEPGRGWALRFVYAAGVINDLGYKEVEDLHDWVPIGEIYDRYAEVWQDSPHPVRFPTLLARQEFGELLGQVLLGVRVSRRMGKKTVRGLAGITGPGGRRTRESKVERFTMKELEKYVNDGT